MYIPKTMDTKSECKPILEKKVLYVQLEMRIPNQTRFNVSMVSFKS